MGKEEILQKLEDIASAPGFIYTLSFLLVKDLFLDPSELADIDWQEKLSYQELALLIGLMVKHEVTLTYPDEQQCQSDISQVDVLFQQLHFAHAKPLFDHLTEDHAAALQTMTDEQKETAFRNLFGSGQMMQEPIFYSGSGAYDFQYKELAVKKYAYDAAWIKKEKGFSIARATQIATDLKSLAGKKHGMIKKPSSFEDYCRQIFGIFCLSLQDLSGGDEAEDKSFLAAFSFKPGTVNENLQALGQYNALSSHPIISLEENLFYLPVHYLLVESLYESPFYWTLNTSYEPQASNNRGKATEDIAYDMLLPVFGAGLFKNITIQRSKGQDATDIDILAVAGNKAIVFQAKSKRLTELARRGDTARLKKDFDEAVQAAYNQGLICRQAILNNNSRLVDATGTELTLNEAINEVYLVCVTSDNYPAIKNQVDMYLSRQPGDPHPICMSVFDLDIIAYYLADPFEFLYYIRQRINHYTYFKAASEVAFLGFHLNQKLFASEDAQQIAIDEGFAQLIDAHFPTVKGHQPTTAAVERLQTKWKNAKFNKLIQEVKDTHESGFTDAIFFLYDLSGSGADELIKAMERTITWTKRDGQHHDFSIIYGKNTSGITFFCQQGTPDTLGPRLMQLAMARKYKTKADLWLALGSNIETDRMVDVLAFSDQLWAYDKEQEDLTKIHLKPGISMGKNGEKVGRNDPCPCGEIKLDGKPVKFKHCCGK
jgi:hypothetical protein